MKHIKLYLTALLFASLGLASCEDNWDTPPLDGPGSDNRSKHDHP